MAAASGWSAFLGRYRKKIAEGVEAWNQWRDENPGETTPPLNGVSLAQRNLEGVNLRGALLRDADLNHANLKKARLDGADLHNASLLNVSMQDAVLRGASLSAATVNGDLRRVDLSGARLLGTQIYGCMLAGANFERAACQATVFAALDLSACKNLASVRHQGRSTIGIDTIFYSRGRIPAEFLEKAGLSRAIIDEIPALVAAVGPEQFYSCFISYSHTDAAVAQRIHDRLAARGIRCWRDENDMRLGDDIPDAIQRGIQLYDKLLVCCSMDSMKSGWVDREIALGLEKEERLSAERGKKVQAIIPVDLDGHIRSDVCTSPYRDEISRRLAGDFTGCSTEDKKFDVQLERLVLALRADDAARRRPPAPKL